MKYSFGLFVLAIACPGCAAGALRVTVVVEPEQERVPAELDEAAFVAVGDGEDLFGLPPVPAMHDRVIRAPSGA